MPCCRRQPCLVSDSTRMRFAPLQPLPLTGEVAKPRAVRPEGERVRDVIKKFPASRRYLTKIQKNTIALSVTRGYLRFLGSIQFNILKRQHSFEVLEKLAG